MILKAKCFIGWLFPYDKLKHFTFVGVLPSLILLNWLNPYYTFGIISIIAVIIEVVDKKTKKGNAEWLDIVYALVGSIIVILI